MMSSRHGLTLVLVVLLLSACAGQGKRAMEGGCEDYRMDMRRELALADSLGIPTLTYTNTNNDTSAVSMNAKLDVSLYPSNEVQFLVEPEKRGKKADEFAGLVKVRVSQ